MAGTAAAEGRPSGLFVAHAAAITEVWLALVEQGPAAGIEVTGWLTDRAGWQEWTRNDRWSSHPLRLTPDAVATFAFDGAKAVAFVEVDLASMTQTLLKQKVARYLAYADDRAWQDRYPYCPPMLLLTTTATRAASFIRVAGQVLARHRADDNDRAAMLLAAACGHVRAPAQAIAEPSWGVPDTATAELTLAEILTERRAAKAASDAWLYERDVVQRRRDDIGILRSLTQFAMVADWLGSDRAAEVLRALIGADPAVFLDGEPDLAAQAVDWFDRRRRLDRFRARELAKPLVAILEARHDTIWREQARRLLTADEGWVAYPRVCQLAAKLAAGALGNADEITALDTCPAESRAAIQQRILGDYQARRTDAVTEEWSLLGRRERRRFRRDQREDAYDEQHLLMCDTCALAYPTAPDCEPMASRCSHCAGALLDWRDRTSVPTPTQRLNSIHDRLRRTGARPPVSRDWAGR